MLTRLDQVRRWQRRRSPLITGLLMTFLWTCIGIATPFLIVKCGLFPIALWKLIDTLNAATYRPDEDEVPHVGGGITSSAAAAAAEKFHAPVC